MKQETIVAQAGDRSPAHDPAPHAGVGCGADDALRVRPARGGDDDDHPPSAAPRRGEAFVAQAMRTDTDEAVWAMDATDFGGSELLGVISLTRMDRGQSEIGYWVAPAMWNTGFASEAVGRWSRPTRWRTRRSSAACFRTTRARRGC
jgi:hypothetical protein